MDEPSSAEAPKPESRGAQKRRQRLERWYKRTFNYPYNLDRESEEWRLLAEKFPQLRGKSNYPDKYTPYPYPRTRWPRWVAQAHIAAEVWRPEYANTIAYHASVGATPEEIAICLGVRLKVLERWAREKYEVQRALAVGTKMATANVKASVYANAVGYEHPETKVHFDSEVKEWFSVETVKRYKPDHTAAEAFLRNHDPSWKPAQSSSAEAPRDGSTFIQNNTTINVVSNETRERNATLLESVAGRIAGEPPEGSAGEGS